MTKEAFILDAFNLMLKHMSVRMRHLNPEKHGISGNTAWRVLRNLKEFGVVAHDGFHNWSLTEKGKEMFCGDCGYRKRCNEFDQKRHREISEMLAYRSMHPEPLPRRRKRRKRHSK